MFYPPDHLLAYKLCIHLPVSLYSTFYDSIRLEFIKTLHNNKAIFLITIFLNDNKMSFKWWQEPKKIVKLGSTLDPVTPQTLQES